ncbi:hypothetical protein BDK51DRAFT_29980 [Blyttiomyces helicus]|uniref:LIM zinc-binding domain-containing protein n=1 Tax=Blyttiomyces helicus TaxID=388810 RepID=A0A4P9WC13_9FUNG|nr:hypothetical protein BDK51DRAFT_29980 [Blyttiomyces helicus]|eukprot:RKO90179.1 hypothetical protein BDK51DRAFT_29980 [Blyttiomyces helicus]
MSDFSSRLQFFAQFQNSQVRGASPGATKSAPATAAQTQSGGTDQAADESGRFLTLKERLARYGSSASASPSPQAEAASVSAGTSPGDVMRGAAPRVVHDEIKVSKVYVVEQVTVDNRVFHKTCLRCQHCKSTLKMGNLASMGGQYYCKPHFISLFKSKGNYNEGFGQEEAKRAWLKDHQGRA